MRWTEQRNFEAVLGALERGTLRVDELITDRLPLARAVQGYGKIRDETDTLGVVLEYPARVERSAAVLVSQRAAPAAGDVVAGLIGAGNFARSVLLPALGKTRARLAYVANRTAAVARHTAEKFGAEQAVSDYRQLLADDRVNLVLITVGHELHARLVREALEAGKHVFVEKPLALDLEQLDEVTSAVRAAADRQVVVGYNRRFSPHTEKIRSLIGSRGGPLCMSITVNAGELPADHWTQDPERGGGRIIGEACHFIDLLAFLADSSVVAVSSSMVGEGPAVREDKMAIVLRLADGSIGTINYFANGARAYPKERLELFGDGRVLQLDNFRTTRGWGFRGFGSFRTTRQDKGHVAELAALVERVGRGGEPLMRFDRLRNISLASFAAVRAARERTTVELAPLTGEAG